MSAGETIDQLKGWDLQLIQQRDGYRFSLDPLLLCDFARIYPGDSIVDLGAGCGIIPMVLARKHQATGMVYGIEKQQPMAAIACRNVQLNAMTERVTILHEDILSVRKLFKVSTFDVVTANPPFRVPGAGKVSPKSGRDEARHESTAGLLHFLEAAKFLVKPSGRVAFVYHPPRLAELLATAASIKLSPLRLRFVHDSRDAEAGMVLIELVKGRPGTLAVLPPLIVRDAKDQYSAEVQRILKGVEADA